MKVYYRIIITLLLLTSSVLTAIAQTDNTDELPPTGNIVTVSSAFVRSGPGDNFVAVGALFEGDLVTPLNISEDRAWILIPYSRGTGWVQRSLVRWEDEAQIDALPTLEANITPTPSIPITNTPFLPTFTPEGNYVNPQDAASVYVRGGPGRTYLRLGQLAPGDNVEPVGRNENTTWILIRFSNEPLEDGFGWVAVELVYWEDFNALEALPVLSETDLTPTATFTASATSRPTLTPSITVTIALLPTDTNVPTSTATTIPTDTPQPTNSATSRPLVTPISTETVTAEPSSTNTDVPTDTAQPTNTATATPTNTSEPTATATPTETATITAEPSATNTNVPTNTPQPTNTATLTITPETTPDIFAIQSTEISTNATNEALGVNPEPSPVPLIEEDPLQEGNGFNIPVEAIIGGILFLIVLVYIWFYYQGLTTANRYGGGFVIEQCPVCQRGELHLEKRQSRVLGIPRVRHTVRCDECRSILRETAIQRWRYAVDRIENPAMYDRFNGRELTDGDLKRLVKSPPTDVTSARSNPEFTEDETEN